MIRSSHCTNALSVRGTYCSWYDTRAHDFCHEFNQQQSINTIASMLINGKPSAAAPQDNPRMLKSQSTTNPTLTHPSPTRKKKNDVSTP